MKTYAFIDASNIIYGARAEGWFIDLRKLFAYLKRKYQTSRVYFYFGKDRRNKKQERFIAKLKEFGYTLRIKDVKIYGEKRKANCDVDLTMDMILSKEKYDRAVVLTGDGDFLPLFVYLKKQKKEIIIIAFTKRTSGDLKRFAGKNFVTLSNERYLIERKPKKVGRTLN